MAVKVTLFQIQMKRNTTLFIPFDERRRSCTFHTNSIEDFWSQLKRGIIGIYYLVSPKHLPKYCKEFVFRYNTRKESDSNRFNAFLQQSTERLYYGELLMKPEWRLIG